MSKIPKKEKILAVIVTHNRKDLLKRCILSLLKQTYSSLEIIVINNGSTDGTKKMLIDLGINSIDQDGAMKGYDYKIIDDVRKTTSLPMTVLGGAGSLDDLGNLIKKYRIIGAGAGSLFVFKGKYRAVLINYPSQEEKDKIIQ